MALVYVEDKAATAEFYPPVLPSSATLTIYNPGGTSQATPSVSVDSTDTTVSTVTDQTTMSLASTSGMVVGRQYWWLPASSSSVAGCALRLGELDTSTDDVVWESPAAGTVAAADAIKGLRLSATIASTVFDERGLFWRLEWAVTDAASEVHYYRQVAHVVRTPFRAAVTADEAARYVSGLYPNYHVSADAGHYAELARRASDRVERRLVASGRYPHLIGDHDAFVDAGLVSLRLELAMEGLYPPGMDAQLYAEEQERALDRQVSEAIASLWYDADDGGDADTATEVRALYSVQLSRV